MFPPSASRPWQWPRDQWWYWAALWLPSSFPLCSSSSAPTQSKDRQRIFRTSISTTVHINILHSFLTELHLARYNETGIALLSVAWYLLNAEWVICWILYLFWNIMYPAYEHIDFLVTCLTLYILLRCHFIQMACAEHFFDRGFGWHENRSCAVWKYKWKAKNKSMSMQCYSPVLTKGANQVPRKHAVLWGQFDIVVKLSNFTWCTLAQKYLFT